MFKITFVTVYIVLNLSYLKLTQVMTIQGLAVLTNINIKKLLRHSEKRFQVHNTLLQF